MYKQEAGAYFGTDTLFYSFVNDPGEKIVTVTLPVYISGNAEAYDRKVTVKVVKDSITDAEEQMYELQETIIKAGEFSGSTPIVLHYDERMDKEDFMIHFAIEKSSDFQVIDLNQRNSTVKFSNKVIKPSNWDYALATYFGSYSTRWWKFITEKTGMLSFPYWPNAQDKVTWWLTAEMMKGYQSFIRVELAKYNAEHKEQMTHDDGPKANQLVTVPGGY